MAKWWKFGLGKGKDQGPEEGPAPEPTPAPTPAPAEGGKKPGILGRLFGRRKKKEAPAEAPTAPPAAPPAAPPKPERVYPPFLHVSADGDWVISDTEWSGTMSGTLHGSDVKTFIDAMEAKGGPEYDIAIPLIAEAYGIPGDLIDLQRSTIHSVDY